jgi:DNA repair photolyase
MTKEFNGKAIYQPKGKAGEYSEYACNFYVGCSNQCEYCFLRKGIGKKTLGGNIPTLKKCFKDESDARRVFEKELKQNLPELQEHGLFLSFTTDPMLPETIDLTIAAIRLCHYYNVPVKTLTKLSDFFEEINRKGGVNWDENLIAFGFTLTGHDELEPNASANAERIEAMRKLHKAGFKTWASIEPVIDFKSSRKMIHSVYSSCDLFKIGLESGKKYDKKELVDFINHILENCSKLDGNPVHIYFKDYLLKSAGIRREDLPKNCVTRDYNIFNNN